MEALDPDAVREMARRAKIALRKRMRALRKATPAGARAARSARIVERLVRLPEWERARSIALYAAMDVHCEVDVGAADASARARGASVSYPFMDGERLGFRTTASTEVLTPGEHGFSEPPLDAPEAEEGEIDLVVVPAIAVAPSGHRIGWGSGFYDRVIPRFCPPATSVIVAFDFQLLMEVPASADDVPSPIVVTDARVIRAD